MRNHFPVFNALALGQKRHSMLGMLTSQIVWYWTGMVVATILFLNSIMSGGMVWDDPLDFDKVKQQVSFARDALFGSTNWSFRSFPFGHAFYGIGATLPPYAFSYLIDIVWLNEAEHAFDRSYSLLLRLITFLCAIAGVIYTRRLVSLATELRETPFLAGITLLVIPFWVGYGFFDYKDIPVATGIIASTYYAAAYMQDGRSRTSFSFFLALLFLAAQKLAMVPLTLPACVAVVIAPVHRASVRKIAILAVQGILFLIFLFVVTPPAWREPLAFVMTSVKFMSAHIWGGCTLTAGQCIGPYFQGGQGYSAIGYLATWYAVQFPIPLGIGVLAAVYLYVRSLRHASGCQHLIITALAWPIFAITLRNSTLYDGIRHTLFLVPLAVVMVFITIPETFWMQRRWWLACYFLFLLIDAVSLQPYQYVWFNEVARFFATERNFETDYWGYSLRQAAVRARSLQGPSEWVISPTDHSNPNHLVKLFIPERFATNTDVVPLGANYLLVRSTRNNAQPEPGCIIIDKIERRELMAPNSLQLSFVANCSSKLSVGNQMIDW